MDAATGVIIFLAAYLLFILILSYTILFGRASRHATSFIGRANIFLTETLSDYCNATLSRLFCRGVPDPAEKMAACCETAMACFEERVMPFVYLALLLAGLASANAIIIPRLADLNPSATPCPPTRFLCLPGTPLTLPPTTHPSALYAYAILCFGTWLRVFLADPGVITAANHSAFSKTYPYDDVLFVEGKFCATCNLPKLPRSKHDRALDKCVMRYDHFCGWTGNVIGLNNTSRFLAFLMVHLVMLSHGAMLIVEIIRWRFRVLVKGNFTYTPTGARVEGFSLRVAITAEPTLCLFFFVVLVSIGVVGGFLVYHAYLVANNTTTSETFKWTPIRELCVAFRDENHGRSYGDKLKEEALQRAEGDPALVHSVPKFNSDGLPTNIYDRGLVSNFMEVLFPRSFVESGPQRLKELGASKDE